MIKTWVFFALSLLPLFVFKSQHPDALTQRFYLISYIKPDSPWREIFPKFVRRYFEDLSLTNLLFNGDGNPRHHAYDTLGSFLIGAFALVLIGVVVIIVRHWREPWWRFVIFGAAASIVPGALTADQFHSLRLVAYPVFLLVLMVPALQFLLEHPKKPVSDPLPLSPFGRRLIFALLIAAMAAQVIYFQKVYRREGPQRGLVFDADYKAVYDMAVVQPNRPIYLSDVQEPAYVHALWYATVEGRKTSEFVHLEEGAHAPAGSIVIASERDCMNCDVIKRSGDYIVYRQF